MEAIFEILGRIIRHKNGVVSENMSNRGIIYKVNYGVALPTIRQIAEEYAPDHELAEQLFLRDEREAKLAAVFIDNPVEVKAEQLERWAKEFTNVELAEVACNQLFYKTPYALPYSFEWCMSSDIYLQKAGWTLVAKSSQLKGIRQEQLEPYLALSESANLSNPTIQQAVIQALVKFANRSDILRESVIALATKMKGQGGKQQETAEEVLAFLTV